MKAGVDVTLKHIGGTCAMSAERKSRIHQIKRRCQVPIDRNQLIAACCVDWGLSRRTVLEYVRVLIDYRALKQDGTMLEVNND